MLSEAGVVNAKVKYTDLYTYCYFFLYVLINLNKNTKYVLYIIIST